MLDDLERLVACMVASGIRYPDAQREFERRFLEAALRACDHSITRTATLTGLHRNTLARKMQEHALHEGAAATGGGPGRRRTSSKR